MELNENARIDTSQIDDQRSGGGGGGGLGGLPIGGGGIAGVVVTRDVDALVGKKLQAGEPFCEVLAEGSLVLHIGDDLEILPRFPEASFDWLYIDSSHAYEHTGKELRLAERLVKPGGVICGDDWSDDPGHPHHGVRRAVEEFAAASDFRLVYADARDRQWALRRG